MTTKFYFTLRRLSYELAGVLMFLGIGFREKDLIASAPFFFILGMIFRGIADFKENGEINSNE